ncbi:polyprenyl diphosphate synthase [uncultured Cohaesibacter sp.]|uniref:polyprenyl diphosphate synthase n=1 Tax=uncultured Cohaesibacter sp. TaxID=1002546 RepID=UPI003747F328
MPVEEVSEDNGLHVALIMDGNGRWATLRKFPRIYGHKMGIEAVRKVIEAAPRNKIGMLTLYAFSSDNWKRPPEEVTHLFSLLKSYLRQEVDSFVEKGIRLVFIGRRDRIAEGLRAEIEAAEQKTRYGEALIVRIALDYSGREQILMALADLPCATPEALSFALSGVGKDWPVDLLIRTSGEQRLSDFLLWECAYAEFYFSPIHWPDFDGKALGEAVGAYLQRDRRFGSIKT